MAKKKDKKKDKKKAKKKAKKAQSSEDVAAPVTSVAQPPSRRGKKS